MKSPARTSPARLAGGIAIAGLATLLLLAPGLSWQVAADGAALTCRGFPLPWYSPSLVTSLQTDVYILPLGIDVLVCLLAARFVWGRLAKRLGGWRRRIAALLGAAGLVCLAHAALTFGLGTRAQLWYDAPGLLGYSAAPRASPVRAAHPVG